MGKKSDKSKKDDSVLKEIPEIEGSLFGIDNTLWNALLAVISFFVLAVSYILVAVISRYFVSNLHFVSSHLPVPPLIAVLNSIFVPEPLYLTGFIALVIGIFYVLYRAIRKHTKNPPFFYISFFVQFYITLIFTVVLYEFIAMYRVFIK